MRSNPIDSSSTSFDNTLCKGSVPTISRVALGMAVTSCLVCLLLLVYLMARGAPIADDYCRGILGWQNAFSFANYQYMHWTGRWTSMALESFLFSAFNLYRSVPLILLALFALRFLALTYLVRVTLRIGMARSLFWAMLVISAWVSVSPGTAEGELWATGAIEYQLPLTLMLFAFALISQSRWIASLPFLIVSATMNELVALALTGMCASLFWMRRRKRESANALVLLTLLTACLTALVLLAPGNPNRLKVEHSELHTVSAVGSSLVSLISGVANWTTACTIIGLLAFLAGTRVNGDRARPALLDVIGWPCVYICLISVAALIPYDSIPDRVWDVLCFLYVLLLFYGTIWLAPSLEIGRNARFASLLMFSLGLLASRNFKDLAHSVVQARDWNQALAERARTHRFERIQWPRSYMSADVTSDSNHWCNKCEAGYLHMESVRCPTCEAPTGGH